MRPQKLKCTRFSSFADKMQIPDENIGISDTHFFCRLRQFSWCRQDEIYRQKYRHSLRLKNCFFICRRTFSGPDKISAFFMTNDIFVCRQNERPNKRIGIPLSKLFLYLPMNFVWCWQNIDIFHIKCFLYLLTKLKAR